MNTFWLYYTHTHTQPVHMERVVTNLNTLYMPHIQSVIRSTIACLLSLRGKKSAWLRRESSTEALCWSSFEWIIVSYFSGHRRCPSAQAYQCASAPRHVLSLTLSGCIHWSPCCSLQNTSIGQSGSNCLLRDIKAPKLLVHLLCSGAGQKQEQQREEKLLWTPFPASVYSLSF